MQDKNLFWKVLFIVLVILWSVYQIYPPSKQLKGGIDLVGGYSLLYEIDTSGLKNTAGLSTRVMERLKQRVDPDGVRNLVWRPVGDTRLEIQMPLPPKETIEMRKKFRAAMDALVKTNVRVSEVERALSLPANKRQKALARLVRGVPERKEILKELVKAYDAWMAARKGHKDKSVIEDLERNYEAVLDKLLATNFDIKEFNDVLELGMGLSERQRDLESLKKKYPSRIKLIENAIKAYADWAKVKGPLDNPSDLMRLLRGQGVLEFHILATSSVENPDEFADYIKRLEEKGPRVRPEDEFAWYEVQKEDAIKVGIKRQWGGKWWVLAYYKDPMKVLDKSRPDWKLTEAYPTRDSNGMPAVGFEFNDVGASYFLELTRNNLKRYLCIILDGKAISAPMIQSAISKRGIITGKFTDEEIKYLVSTLNAGSLDARLKDNPIAVHSIGPSLGQDNRRAGLRAAVYGLIAVAGFMAIYYLWAGLIADFALVMNLLLLLAVMAALEATFTMAGIAGVILTMGMAVDANVLIYERMREESERVQSLRLIIKNGYDKALSTIVDANVTTLITSVVLYYIGTEEIKGFALVLALGLIINMFTALFVTRVVFNLLVHWKVIKSLPMLRFFRKPSIDWMGKQKYFWFISISLIIVALITFPARGQDKYGIEFRGGTSIQVELKKAGLLSIEQVRKEVSQAGDDLIASADDIEKSKLMPVSGRKDVYDVKFSGITAHRFEAAIVSFMEDNLEKGSVKVVDGETIEFQVKSSGKKHLSLDEVRALLKKVAEATRKTGRDLKIAQVQSVGKEHKRYEIVTVATAQQLVIDAILSKLGPYLNIQQAIQFDPDIKVYPIEKKSLRDVIGDPNAPGYVPDYLRGVAMVVDKLSPAVTTSQLRDRIISMRLQPDFSKLQWRDFDIIGLKPASGQDIVNLPEEKVKYVKVAVVVYDPNYIYDEDPKLWKSQLVEPELNLLQEALSRTSELQKVTQFAAQVAEQARNAAFLALIVAFGAIIMYLWIRFGTPRHGVAAIIALLHDVTIAVAFVMLAQYFYDSAVGKALMLRDFKIDLAMIAAFLTVIGYSVNDTIVVYDRIRENKGKLRDINRGIINESINQTLTRTILTSLTTLMVMVILYVFGGEGAHGFSYVMIIGTMVGTYSSIAIASPLLIGWLGDFGKGKGQSSK